ncbi:hypothetical protein AB0D90_19925 [Streptomyces althioticus]|uniref:Uncharacterized protein n=2 Tax=Streptomyces althioticus group TaxID=2867194 RepID=A0ABR4T144_9ACTN|nr:MULTISPECIES: hypothetical protein [Actinomycetes]KEG41031.1 hypothetical protein DJ64_05425 [Streptomyces griseorubens]MBM4829680.1 hypothetical protein [Actinospica acidiphila]
MKRTPKYLAGAAVTAAVAGMATMSYAAPHDTAGRAPHSATATAAAPAVAPAAKHAPTPRIVQPGERVTGAPGFELWLTPEGKHWTTPDMPEGQFRSVVDGNVDLSSPGVSVQSEGTPDRVHLSGLYYGGKGTASTVELRTAAGTLHGKLIELPGRPGWGVWYAVAEPAPNDGSRHFVSEVTVRTTKGKVYASISLR